MLNKLIAVAAGVLISGMIWHLADWLDAPTLDMEPRSAGIVGQS